MAWLGASAYAKIYLTDPEAVEVKLTKQNLNDSTGYYSIGFARKDSGITIDRRSQGQEIRLCRTKLDLWLPRSCGRTDRQIRQAGRIFREVKMSGGHEQTIVGVDNGDFDAGVSWADGLGNWEDGYNSGAFRKAADAGLVDMNNLVEIWRSTLIPEGPMVVRKALPQDVKDKVTR